jgi:hypothetical protein
MPVDAVTYYSDLLLKDTAFARFYLQTGEQIIAAKRNGSIDRFRALQPRSITIQQDQQYAHGTLERMTDAEATVEEVYHYTAGSLTNGTLFYLSNPGFFDLSMSDQQSVFDRINDRLADPSYCASHAQTPLVTAHHQLMQEANNGYGRSLFYQDASSASRTTNELSWGVVGACISAAIGAIIYDYGGLIKTIAGAFSGTDRVMWGMVYQVAKSAVKTMVPWYKVLGLAIGLGTCLWSAL